MLRADLTAGIFVLPQELLPVPKLNPIHLGAKTSLSISAGRVIFNTNQHTLSQPGKANKKFCGGGTPPRLFLRDYRLCQRNKSQYYKADRLVARGVLTVVTPSALVAQTISSPAS